MIIEIIVSFICFFNCMNLYHLIATQKKESNFYKYKDYTCGTYLNMGKDVSLGNFLYDERGILRVQDATLYRDAVNAPGLADIILSQKEPLIYPVVEGKLPETDKELRCPTVILGRKHLQDVIYENGKKYYEIEGVMCQVCAVLGSEGSDIFDYKVILYYEGLNDELRRCIDVFHEFSFVIESNRADTQFIMKNLQERTKKYTSEVALGGGIGETNEYQVGVEEDISYYLIIFLFCVVNVIVVSEYWIKRRYKEIAIRRIFGYSDIRIYAVLYRDLVLNVSIAVGIALLIQGLLQNAFKEYMHIYMSQLGYYIGYSVLFIFIISAVIMIYPILLLRKQEIMKQMVSNSK